MKVLFDTNVLIELEKSGSVLSDVLADMVRSARELKYEIMVHPAQVEDLQHDEVEKRREVQLSRIRAYPMLQEPPIPDAWELVRLSWTQSSINDKIDNLLLFAVKRSAVTFLVTEDRKMHKKAIRAGLDGHVFFVEDFLAYLRRQQNLPRQTECAAIQTRQLYSLDYESQFFDTLRVAYPGFNDWYRRCADEGRCCWVVEESSEIKALCIFKAEKDEPITDSGECLLGSALKLCTFKVNDVGRKLGERLLYVAFHYADENKFDYIYIQVQDDAHPRLVDLLCEHGFYRFGEYKKDTSFVKDMRKGVISKIHKKCECLEYAIRHYPHVVDDPTLVNKYVIPIRPEFHDRLFPDVNPAPSLFDGVFGYTSEANAIKKAYLSYGKNAKLAPGDLVFFYRSEDMRHIRCIGIVEEVLRSKSADEIIPFVSKRTVYSNDEIREIADGREVLAILFRVVRYLKKAVSWQEMQNAGLQGPIQTLREIPDVIYASLFKKDLGV